MNDLRDYDLTEIEQLVKDLGWRKFKAKELFRAVHRQLKSIDQMTTLSKEERQQLNREHFVKPLQVDQDLKGKDTRKVSFLLDDGQKTEAVLMSYEAGRKTICISSQIGCPVGCLFCATGQMGFKRSLTTAEILGQVYHFAAKEEIDNIVFMGMGEPFLNYDNVLKAAKILNHSQGLNIGGRKITISTIGILKGIERFTEEGEQFRLAWSLVAADDQTRRSVVLLKGLPSIADTVKVLTAYQKKTKRRITIEYVVLKGINDSADNAANLIKIARPLDSHINLIPYNQTPDSPYQAGDAKKLAELLEQAKVVVTIRRSFGSDIKGACGQLAASK
ncbi:MAG: 23S rRNA (adenine(2503)-C(2))-methyltransferase RlmN [Candidatus Saganbacteria bacterium]|nr:23S rRNA (adenine(2503)-C(2))-methyltransferase RlmN [Candidatus Saganbacteria bacterium]